MDARTLLHCSQALEAAHPQAEQLQVIQDNWPTHTAHEGLEGLHGGKLTRVPLPTDAPWTNPIETVWRQLYQEVLHRHPWIDAWDQWQAAVQRWLDHYAAPSDDLLRSVGLGCPP